MFYFKLSIQGSHYWQFKITKSPPKGNCIGFGVAVSDINKNEHVGSDSSGWGVNFTNNHCYQKHAGKILSKLVFKVYYTLYTNKYTSKVTLYFNVTKLCFIITIMFSILLKI